MANRQKATSSEGIIMIIVGLVVYHLGILGCPPFLTDRFTGSGDVHQKRKTRIFWKIFIAMSKVELKIPVNRAHQTARRRVKEIMSSKPMNNQEMYQSGTWMGSARYLYNWRNYRDIAWRSHRICQIAPNVVSDRNQTCLCSHHFLTPFMVTVFNKNT